jgi:hypothetical protein
MMLGVIKHFRRSAVLVLPLCMLALAVSPAGAATIGKSHGLLYASKSGSVATSSGEPTSGDVSVFCPKPYTAIGGGATITGSAARTFLSSDTNESNRSWYAQAWHTNEPKSTLTTIAICSKSKSLTRDRGVSTTGPGPVVASGDETCTSGNPISGGALAVGEPSSWFLNSTYPKSIDSWQAYAGYTGASSASLLVDIVCTDGAKPRYVQENVHVAPAAVATVKAPCKHGKAVEGGGGYLSDNSLEAHILKSLPYDGADKDKVPDDGWSVKARNDSGAAKTLYVSASCKA